jgi:hypothetical protein
MQIIVASPNSGISLNLAGADRPRPSSSADSTEVGCQFVTMYAANMAIEQDM